MTSFEYDFPNNTLGVWDYVLFGLVLAVSVGIGIYYGCTGGRQKTTSEFLMADRQMTVFPVTLSLLASFMSAITLLGTPAEVYTYGTQYWMIWIGYLIMIPLAAYVYMPIFFELRLTTVYEVIAWMTSDMILINELHTRNHEQYLEMRFGPPTRVFAAICFIVQTILYMSIVLYTPCLALSVVTGFNKWITVVLVGLVCTFYTTIGGIKAVMWTDVFQIFMMFAGLIAVIIKGSIDFNGFHNVWQRLEEGQRVEFFDFDPDPLKRHSIWSLSFGGCFTWLAIYGVNQSMVQRVLTTKKLKFGQTALWWNLPGLTAILTVSALCGVVVFAEYQFCDPIITKRIEARDQLLPQYVMDRLYYPALPGLFTACLFSGALSTISSGLNSLAATTLQDLIKKCKCGEHLSEAKATNISKILAFAYGMLMIALSFVASQLGGVLQAALGLFGMIGGPVLGLFTLGIIYPWANQKGALTGTVIGLILTLWLGIGAQVYKPGVYKPPVNISGCPLVEINDTMTTSWDLYSTTVTELITTTPAAPPLTAEEKSGYLPFYRVSYMWYSAFAVLVTTVSGLIVSAITGPNNPRDVDSRLIHPIIYELCCCCSPNSRQKLKCHVGENVQDVEEVVDGSKVIYSKDISGQVIAEKNGHVNPGLDVSSEGKPGDDILYSTHL